MSITDKVCCGFTILIIFIYLALMGASFVMGPMEHIAKPYDMNGQLCQGSYLYFLTPQQGFLFRTACLTSCPKTKDSTLSCSSPNIKCTPNNSPTNPSEQVVVYDTDLYNNMACLPTDYKLFQIVMEGMTIPPLQQFASKLKGDYIGILFGAFASMFLGILFLKLQKSYSTIMIQIINIAYPIIITLVLLFLINSVSEFTKANVIDQLGDKRPLINTSMALLLDSHFNKIYLVILVLIFVIWLFIGLLDIKFNSISLQQVHLRNYIQLSFFKSIKYIYVPLTLSILLTINFAVFYQSIISSIGIGAVSNGAIFYQNSPVGLAFIAVQTILFFYTSILICVYGDTIMFFQSHTNFENLNNQLRSHIVLECLSHLGSVSYLVLKLIIYLPIRWFVDFLYLIHKIEMASKYERKLYNLNTTTIAFVFTKQLSLGESMNNLGQYIQDQKIGQSLYNSGCSFIYKNGFFFMNLLIFSQLMLGTSVCGAILISLLAYQISYVYGVQFSKGACAMQLFKKEIQQEQQDQEQGNVVSLSLFDYMFQIYQWIGHVEQQEQIYQQQIQ